MISTNEKTKENIANEIVIKTDNKIIIENKMDGLSDCDESVDENSYFKNDMPTNIDAKNGLMSKQIDYIML